MFLEIFNIFEQNHQNCSDPRCVFEKVFFQNMYLRVTTATSNINFHQNHAKNIRFVGVFSLFLFFQKKSQKSSR